MNMSDASVKTLLRAYDAKQKADYVVLFFHWGGNWDWMDGIRELMIR